MFYFHEVARSIIYFLYTIHLTVIRNVLFRFREVYDKMRMIGDKMSVQVLRLEESLLWDLGSRYEIASECRRRGIWVRQKRNSS